MAHINSLGAGIYSYLDIYHGDVSSITNYSTAANYAALFASATNGTDHERMPSIREFPSIGTPANIVNVPVYGQPTSVQIQGKSDAPSQEVIVNYVAEDMTDIHNLVGQAVAMRYLMASSEVTIADSLSATLAVNNTEFYFLGKIEAILVNPSLTDAITANVTLSIQTNVVGPATLAAS
jgi:hypothetical protein